MINDNQIAIFGGGCFWCIEAVFKRLKGVESVIPGYAGGKLQSPTYKQVCSSNTGHAEVVKIEFNPEVITYEDLLNVFFATHDSTTKDRQGNDIGAQYQSIILFTDDKQKTEAERFIKALIKSGVSVITELKKLDRFYDAEIYHRDYYEKHPQDAYCGITIDPKLNKLNARFKELLKP